MRCKTSIIRQNTKKNW